LVSTMRSATRRIRSASETEDPPYFCTTSATGHAFQVLGKIPIRIRASRIPFTPPVAAPMGADICCC
jgi:hypothetical protein